MDYPNCIFQRNPPLITLIFKTKAHVSTEMSLHVLAYNMKRVISIMGSAALMKAMAA
jgi:hypothetical protein